MGKLVLFIFSTVLLFGNDELLNECHSCHNNFGTPPYTKVYKHYLLKYSSKARIEKAMLDFLQAPSEEKSAMSKGMKRRFNPATHPPYTGKLVKSAVKYIIEQEDIVKKLKLAPKKTSG